LFLKTDFQKYIHYVILQGIFEETLANPLPFPVVFCCFMCDFYGRDTWAIFITQPAEAETAESKAKGDRKLGGREKQNRARTMPLTFKLLITQLARRHSKFLIKPNCLQIEGREKVTQ